MTCGGNLLARQLSWDHTELKRSIAQQTQTGSYQEKSHALFLGYPFFNEVHS